MCILYFLTYSLQHATMAFKQNSNIVLKYLNEVLQDVQGFERKE